MATICVETSASFASGGRPRRNCGLRLVVSLAARGIAPVIVDIGIARVQATVAAVIGEEPYRSCALAAPGIAPVHVRQADAGPARMAASQSATALSYQPLGARDGPGPSSSMHAPGFKVGGLHCPVESDRSMAPCSPDALIMFHPGDSRRSSSSGIGGVGELLRPGRMVAVIRDGLAIQTRIGPGDATVEVTGGFGRVEADGLGAESATARGRTTSFQLVKRLLDGEVEEATPWARVQTVPRTVGDGSVVPGLYHTRSAPCGVLYRQAGVEDEIGCQKSDGSRQQAAPPPQIVIPGYGTTRPARNAVPGLYALAKGSRRRHEYHRR